MNIHFANKNKAKLGKLLKFLFINFFKKNYFETCQDSHYGIAIIGRSTQDINSIDNRKSFES